MKMTEELAHRIMNRYQNRRESLSNAQQDELLMCWIEGKSHKAICAQFNVSLRYVGRIINQARADAAEVLEARK